MKLDKQFWIQAVIYLVLGIVAVIAASLLTTEIYARRLAKQSGATTPDTPVVTNEVSADGANMRTMKVM